MASCPKCGQYIKSRKGVRKCKRHGFLEDVMSDLLWWGYRHTDGGLQAKRYFSQQDLDEARESPFVASVCPPFKADSRDEALKIIGDRV